MGGVCGCNWYLTLMSCMTLPENGCYGLKLGMSHRCVVSGVRVMYS